HHEADKYQPLEAHGQHRLLPKKMENGRLVREQVCRDLLALIGLFWLFVILYSPAAYRFTPMNCPISAFPPTLRIALWTHTVLNFLATFPPTMFSPRPCSFIGWRLAFVCLVMNQSCGSSVCCHLASFSCGPWTTF